MRKFSFVAVLLLLFSLLLTGCHPSARALSRLGVEADAFEEAALQSRLEQAASEQNASFV